LVTVLVTVKIPVALLQYVGNRTGLIVDAANVEELLRHLDARFPDLSAFIINEKHELRRYVNVFVNEEDVRLGNGLTTQLKEGDRVSIVPIVAGG